MVTSETIRQPGKALNPRAQGPEVGICRPSKTPESRMAKVPAVRPRMTI